MPENIGFFHFIERSIYYPLWILALLLLLISSADAQDEFEDSKAGHNERRLLKTLLGEYPYRDMVLPIDTYDGTDPLKVSISMSLVQIINVDEKNQIITLNIWLTLAWTDKSLVWDPDEYGGLTEIHLNPKKVWKPDVLLYTSADERFDATYHVNVIANYNGSVTWLPPGLVRSTCEIDVTFFPFDTQLCYLKYGVWTYHGFLVDLVLAGADRSTFTKNGEWILADIRANKTVAYYDCCEQPYPDVKFYIYLRRRSMYYTLNILIPCAVLSILSLLSFLLPAETGEKLSFCVTILLSVIVFMLVLADILPSTSLSNPLLGKYFTCVLIMVSISVVMTITTINLSARNPNTHTMPKIARKILLEWLPVLLWMKQPGKVYKPLCRSAERDKLAGHTQPGIELLEHGPSYKDRRGNGVANQSSYFNDVNLIGIKYANYARDEREPMMNDTAAGPREKKNRELCLILEELRALNDRQERQERDDQQIYDWKFASMVIDRLSLIVISVITGIVTFKILSAAPTYEDLENMV